MGLVQMEYTTCTMVNQTHPQSLLTPVKLAVDDCDKRINMRLMTMMLIGSAVSTYTSLIANPAVIQHSIPLYIESVSMSVSSMPAVCLELYKLALTEQLLSISRSVNYQLCTKSLCSYMSGAAGGGASLGDSGFGTLEMYVAIDTSKLASAVKLDYIPSTVTCRFSLCLQHEGSDNFCNTFKVFSANFCFQLLDYRTHCLVFTYELKLNCMVIYNECTITTKSPTSRQIHDTCQLSPSAGFLQSMQRNSRSLQYGWCLC